MVIDQDALSPYYHQGAPPTANSPNKKKFSLPWPRRRSPSPTPSIDESRKSTSTSLWTDVETDTDMESRSRSPSPNPQVRFQESPTPISAEKEVKQESNKITTSFIRTPQRPNAPSKPKVVQHRPKKIVMPALLSQPNPDQNQDVYEEQFEDVQPQRQGHKNTVHSYYHRHYYNGNNSRRYYPSSPPKATKLKRGAPYAAAISNTRTPPRPARRHANVATTADQQYYMNNNIGKNNDKNKMYHQKIEPYASKDSFTSSSLSMPSTPSTPSVRHARARIRGDDSNDDMFNKEFDQKLEFSSPRSKANKHKYSAASTTPNNNYNYDSNFNEERASLALQQMVYNQTPKMSKHSPRYKDQSPPFDPEFEMAVLDGTPDYLRWHRQRDNNYIPNKNINDHDSDAFELPDVASSSLRIPTMHFGELDMNDLMDEISKKVNEEKKFVEVDMNDLMDEINKKVGEDKSTTNEGVNNEEVFRKKVAQAVKAAQRKSIRNSAALSKRTSIAHKKISIQVPDSSFDDVLRSFDRDYYDK